LEDIGRLLWREPTNKQPLAAADEGHEADALCFELLWDLKSAMFGKLAAFVDMIARMDDLLELESQHLARYL
jgi:hypothetical protein